MNAFVGQTFPMNQIVNIKEVVQFTSISRAKIYEMINVKSKYELDFGWGNLKKHGYFSEKLESSIFELNHCSSGK